MPKKVDHHQRREQLAEAAWHIIRRDGIEGVSVRNVAEEAGMSLGSLRHYFTTQSELIAFSMRLASDRVTARIAKLTFSGNPRKDVQMLVCELVPLNEDTIAESEIWLALTAKALVDPVLKTHFQEVHSQLQAFFLQAMHAFAAIEQALPGLQPELEAKRLHALVDGLVLHGILLPGSLSADEIITIVSRHLDSLLEA
ncbi:TetR/AcrR family transcriptional regulator [Paenibacillus gansuensis]|uniref:TetR/AcrR family transcriptional regulator n=1 Tax=Paenibacillus gansuensis TaxID=306542 RepID=A0ABW5PI51_9BACL